MAWLIGRQCTAPWKVDDGVAAKRLAWGPTPRRRPDGRTFSWAIGDATAGAALDGGEDPEADEIETDRPDFTQNRRTVGRGVVQLESGMTYLQGRRDSFSNFSFPETLLRIGIVADSARTAGQAKTFASDRTNDLRTGKHHSDVGAQDLVVGMKLAFTAQQGVLPEMGMIIHSSVPSGSDGLSSGLMLPGVNWLYGWDFTKRWSLSGSTQAYKATALVPLPTSRGGTRSDDPTTHAFVVVAQSFSMEYEITDKLTPYLEWFALFPAGAMSATKSPQHYLDSGFTYKVTPNIQLDGRIGFGLSPHATGFFAGSGLSLRF